MPKSKLSKEQYEALFTNGKVDQPVPPTVLKNRIKLFEPEEEEDFSELEFTGYTKKFIEEDWQTQDIGYLLGREVPGTANWSEMGCYKTSTGLWYVDRKVRQGRM